MNLTIWLLIKLYSHLISTFSDKDRQANKLLNQDEPRVERTENLQIFPVKGLNWLKERVSGTNDVWIARKEIDYSDQHRVCSPSFIWNKFMIDVLIWYLRDTNTGHFLRVSSGIICNIDRGILISLAFTTIGGMCPSCDNSNISNRDSSSSSKKRTITVTRKSEWKRVVYYSLAYSVAIISVIFVKKMRVYFPR